MLRMSSTVFKCVSRDALMFLFFHTSLANTSKCDSSVTHAHSARASRIPRSATDRAHTHTHTLHAPREYLEVRQIVLTLTLTLCTRLANTSKCDKSCSPPLPRTLLAPLKFDSSPPTPLAITSKGDNSKPVFSTCRTSSPQGGFGYIELY